MYFHAYERDYLFACYVHDQFACIFKELTIHYLETLFELLRRHGHHNFALPICALLFYIANDVLNNKFMIILSRLQ